MTLDLSMSVRQKFDWLFQDTIDLSTIKDDDQLDYVKALTNGIGNNGKMFQGNISPALDLTKIDGRYGYMAGKSPVDSNAVPGHLLGQTAVAPSGLAKLAFAAGHDRRNKDLLAYPAVVSGYHGTCNLMP